MTVALVHDSVCTGATRLMTGPAWVGRDGGYWHIPRSGQMFADGRIVWSMWCGQDRHAASSIASDHAPLEAQCATCVGRHAAQTDDVLMFQPRGVFRLPSRCPGNHRTADGHCTACGAHVRWASGWNAYGTAQHRPDPRLADLHAACYLHGWTRMQERAPGLLVCGHWQCGHESRTIGDVK